MRHNVPLALALGLTLVAGACATATTPQPEAFPQITAAGSAQTVTGEVVWVTDVMVTVQTAAGNQLIGLDAQTEGRNHLQMGADVAIDTSTVPGGPGPRASRVRLAAPATSLASVGGAGG